MRQILLWWRNLNNETKKSLMTERNIKSITYSDIKDIYNQTSR